jgi:hypothetical protein
MIVNVTTHIASKSGSNVWFYFDAPYASLEDLHADLVEDGSILGDRIDSQPVSGDFRRRQIVRRIPCVVGHHSIATIMPADEVVFVEGAR